MIYMYICAYIHICVYICTHGHMHIRIRYTHVFLSIHALVYSFNYIECRRYRLSSLHGITRMDCIYIYIYVCIYIYMIVVYGCRFMQVRAMQIHIMETENYSRRGMAERSQCTHPEISRNR